MTKEHNVSETICETAEDAKEKFDHIKKDLINYAQKNPLKTVGFSLLAGIIAAKILFRK